MDNREIILTRAHAMLGEIGPTAMTMDMVARACGISKRTLYETFPDKKTLVLECINADAKRNEKESNEIYANAANCFEGLFKVFKVLRRYNTRQSQLVLDEVVRLYPEIKEHKRGNEHRFIQSMIQVIEQARDQGLVLEDIDSGIAAILFISMMTSLHKSGQIEAMGYDKGHVFDAAFVNFLRGIATAKGREVIESSLKQYMD